MRLPVSNRWRRVERFTAARELHVVATTMASSIKTQIIGYGEPVRTTTNVFLRPPHIIISDGAQLEIFRIGGSINPRPGYGVPRVFKTSLGKYVMKEFEIHKEALKGRGVNVVHGCDLQDGTLACGTATGLVLVFDLANVDTSDGPPVTDPLKDGQDPGTLPGTTELRGHTKVVGFLRLGVGCKRLYTSSLDRTVRIWGLPSGDCFQTVKVGTTVLQLLMLPPSSSSSEQQKIIFGGGDGLVRMYDPDKKPNKALTTLSKYSHKEYVGELFLADGITEDNGTIDATVKTLVSCGRDGSLMLWRADNKNGFIPMPDRVPDRNQFLPMEYWRVDLCSHGLLGITRKGGIHLWRKSKSEGAPPERVTLLADAFSSELRSTPCDGFVRENAQQEAWYWSETRSTPPLLEVVFVGMRPGSAASGAGTQSSETHILEVHTATIEAIPEAVGGVTRATAPATAATGGGKGKAVDVSDGVTTAAAALATSNISGSVAALPERWDRWCELAAEEGVEVDLALQKRLLMMETVAASSTGAALSEATVRACLKKLAIKK